MILICLIEDPIRLFYFFLRHQGCEQLLYCMIYVQKKTLTKQTIIQ